MFQCFKRLRDTKPQDRSFVSYSQMAGPIWTGPLHDLKFVQEVAEAANQLELKNTRRITGMLAVMLEELEVPLYYTLTNLCSVLHCEVIPMQDFRYEMPQKNSCDIR